MSRITVRASVAGVLLAVCISCGGSDDKSPGTSSSTAPGQGATITGNGPRVIAVDLTFTGTLDVRAQGTAGECQLGHSAEGALSAFGFNATEDDYPGLGDNLNFSEDSGTGRLSIKWAPRRDLAWFGYMGAGTAVSPDHEEIRVDTDLPKTPGKPEHVKGTIMCAG